jgi:hypothetical protein
MTVICFRGRYNDSAPSDVYRNVILDLIETALPAYALVTGIIVAASVALRLVRRSITSRR